VTRKYNLVPLKLRRRLLRKNSTPAEIIFWNAIRNQRIGHRFVRQYSVEGYVLDFYCPRAKLAIEIEGKIHLKKVTYDKYRERYLQAFGINILKFTNEEITSSLPRVLKIIKSHFPSL
jgi:very-short-patch-repair endonuclease